MRNINFRSRLTLETGRRTSLGRVAEGLHVWGVQMHRAEWMVCEHICVVVLVMYIIHIDSFMKFFIVKMGART